MALSDIQKKERSEFLEQNLIITECWQRKEYVFISYASSDWEKVFKQAVVPMQREYGLRVYADKAFDKEKDSWIKHMLRNIRASKAVIAFISQSYIESYACFLELLTAVNNNVPTVFAFIDDELSLSDSTDQIFVEPAAKAQIMNQGRNLAITTNNTSIDIKRAMLSAYTTFSTFISDNVVSKYDITDTFIGFFHDASINRKSIYDLLALARTIKSVNKQVFDPSMIAQPEQKNNDDKPQAQESGHPENKSDNPALSAADSSPARKNSGSEPEEIPSDDSLISQKLSSEDADKQSGHIENDESAKTVTIIEDRHNNGNAACIYEGGIVGDKYNGQGKQTWYDEIGRVTSVYAGGFNDGKRCGQGKRTWYYENGTISQVYVGEYKDDNRNGQGELTMFDEGGNMTRAYVGGFKDDIFSGQGKYTWYDENGRVTSVYVGEFRDDNINGQGKETIYDEKGNITYVYEGEFKDGKLNGQGRCTWYYENGNITSVYVGEYKDGKRNGWGKRSWYDEKGNTTAVYEGEYRDDKRNGKGKRTYYDYNGNVTSTYVGEFMNDKLNGQGELALYDKNGFITKVRKGKFVNGEFVG